MQLPSCRTSAHLHVCISVQNGDTFYMIEKVHDDATWCIRDIVRICRMFYGVVVKGVVGR